MRVLLPAYLRAYAGGNAEVALAAPPPATVGDALEAVRALHPGVIDRVLTETGAVRRHVNLFVGAESIRFTGGLATPVADGDEIAIVPAVSGG